MKLLAFLIFVGLAGGAVYYFFPGLFVEVPNDRMARSAVADVIADQSQDVSIELFQKVDGQDRTDSAGVRRYVLEYKCAAKFAKDTMWSFGGNGFETTDPLPEDASRKQRKEAEERLAGKQPAKAGDTVLLKGRVVFEKKESGWNVKDVTIDLDR